MVARERVQAWFPKLTDEPYRITSPEDRRYNCVAWAIGEAGARWWPYGTGSYYWPAGVAREETLEAFVAMLSGLGFVPCEGAELESGFLKVAIYRGSSGRPTHMARQLPSGRWTSKLGRWEDIEHGSPDSLSGPIYGIPCMILRRATAEGASFGIPEGR